ncbi:hypothetical protein GFY24_00120 [Nocardia sp. SYP-A9097]|uniref:hypothetical protein n=1 Tax=Nocardia sp. SYP-A9097 TaxID=2663237 RepID=UPI00129B4CA4|nr:hypothetical protein [Nocardia sp. SYP-A9097]MRH85883.1 hypothetical protein [Nocardia sp. SYP-A9097]
MENIPDPVEIVMPGDPDARTAHTLKSREYEALIIAQPPWVARNTIIDCEIAEIRPPCVLVSANGFWPGAYDIPGRSIGSISVTCAVGNIDDRLVYSPRTSGYIVGPSSAYVEYFSKCAQNSGLACEIVGDCRTAAYSKCLVNIPLTLQYGLSDCGESQLISNPDVVFREALQIVEFTGLMKSLDVEIGPTPGFDSIGLIQASRRVADIPDDPVAMDNLRGILRNWRQGRNPALGVKIRRERGRTAVEEIEWVWGRILTRARTVGASLPVTESLYARVLSDSSGGAR